MNQTDYRTVFRGGTGEITEKKSRFLATVLPIKTEDEALLFIEQCKKKYWDASHNCSAYVLGFQPELQRCSDDGEPAKTAGRPMLDVLVKEGIRNTAVVVTRYFGGTLLGTGGLVRAYTEATKAGLANSLIIEKQYGKKLAVLTDYTGLGKLQYLAAQNGLELLDTEYTDSVRAILFVPPVADGAFRKALSEATNGRAVIEELEECFCARVEGKFLTFSD